MDEMCPECGGEVACECKKEYTWRCIESTGIFIGCGWTGEEPLYPLSTENLWKVKNYLKRTGQAST